MRLRSESNGISLTRGLACCAPSMMSFTCASVCGAPGAVPGMVPSAPTLAGLVGCAPSALRAICASAVSIGSPSSVSRPSSVTLRRLWQCAATSKKGRCACAICGHERGSVARPSAKNTVRTVMRFWVSVPVLSVQMTVAAPSVSTAVRWRTSALRRAMRCVPIARASVTVGSKPSGTLATMMPMAKMKFSQNGSPMNRPTAKNTTPSATDSIATRRDSRAISRCSGDCGSRPVWVRWAILPNSVCMPVANTRPLPLPETIDVPASSTLRAASRSGSSEGAALRALGSDSPVTVAALRRIPEASMRRQSAGTSSPSCTRIRSPGTSVSAGRRQSRPSLSTVT